MKKQFIVNTYKQLNKYAHDLIAYNIEYPSEITTSMSEEHGVAAYPVINDVQRLYNQLNDIVQYESSNRNIPEIDKHTETVKFKLPGIRGKSVPCITHTVRMRFNDSDFSFKEYFDLPNSIFTFIIKNYIIDDPITAALILKERGDSYYIMSDGTHFHNGKMITSIPQTIAINTIAINGIIDLQLFFKSFFHEFNHLSQDFNNIKKNNTREREKAYIRDVIMHHFKNDADIFNKDDISAIINILYCLCGDTEINAFVAELFAELITDDIDVNNIQSFLKNSSTWQIAEKTAKSLDHIMKFNEEQLWHLHDVFIESKYVKNLTKESKNILEFKRRLYKDINNRLKKLVDNMSKVVGFYCASIKNTNIS